MQPQAEISLKNLVKNYSVIQELVGDRKVMAVVKANAYGHGAIPVAKTLSDTAIFGFCVALVQEIKELRDNGITKPILHLGKFSYNDLEIFDKNTICTINSYDDINNIQNYYMKTGVRVKAHVKFDTGLGRMGFHYSKSNDVLDTIKKTDSIILEGIYSHFSTSNDFESVFMDIQRDRFDSIIQIANTLFDDLIYHISNSGGALISSKNHYDLIRPGISLYGITPFCNSDTRFLPVMHFKSNVVLVKNIKKGESIGYNQSFISDKNIQVAIIQAGYGDGIPIEFSNKGYVSFNNKKMPILGMVSMDLIVVDCTDLNIKIGDMITIWGNNYLRVDQISNELDKNPYSLLTGVSNRVKRKYINE